MTTTIAMDTPVAAAAKRLGFLTNEFLVPDDFNNMGGKVIEQLFGGDISSVESDGKLAARKRSKK